MYIGFCRQVKPPRDKSHVAQTYMTVMFFLHKKANFEQLPIHLLKICLLPSSMIRMQYSLDFQQPCLLPYSHIQHPLHSYCHSRYYNPHHHCLQLVMTSGTAQCSGALKQQGVYYCVIHERKQLTLLEYLRIVPRSFLIASLASSCVAKSTSASPDARPSLLQ